MPSKPFLHNHPDFSDLLRIIGQQQSIDPLLVEKDYWIMHCLFGLQQLGIEFELKGGTSLSKGFGLIAQDERSGRDKCLHYLFHYESTGSPT